MRLIILRPRAGDRLWRWIAYGIIERSLRELQPQVRQLRAASGRDLRGQLTREKCRPDNSFVFSAVEYLDEARQESVPALLEEWGFAHLGSSASTIRTLRNKARTKELLADHGIPTPRFFVAYAGKSDMHAQARAMGYPLVVRPLRDDLESGACELIATSPDEMERFVARIFSRSRQPSIVERCLAGPGIREFRVGIIGTYNRMSLSLELDRTQAPVWARIFTKERGALNQVENRKTRDALVSLAEKSCNALRVVDCARIVIRSTRRGLFVGDVDVMPDLAPGGFLARAARRSLGWEYGEFVRFLAMESIIRQEKRMKRKR